MSETQWRTHRLELDDQTLREWDAPVLAAGDEGIVLDRSAFYPGGGGQPPDHGVLLWGGVQTRIEGARKGDDLYLIPAEGDPLPPAGTAVRGALVRRAPDRADAHPLRPARAVRRGVPRLRGAGHRRQHGAADRSDGLQPARPAGRLPGRGRGRVQRRDPGRPAHRRARAAPGRGVRPARHHPDRHQPGAARGQGRARGRHRGPGPAGGRRHPRRVDPPGRPDRGRQDREQGQGLPPPAHPRRATKS